MSKGKCGFLGPGTFVVVPPAMIHSWSSLKRFQMAGCSEVPRQAATEPSSSGNQGHSGGHGLRCQKLTRESQSLSVSLRGQKPQAMLEIWAWSRTSPQTYVKVN